MENQRLLLYFTLFFIVYLLWAEWQMDYGPKQEAPVAQTPPSADQPQPVAEVPEAAAVAPAEAGIVDTDTAAQAAGRRIRVLTDVFDIQIDTRGGDVSKAVLRNYARTADKPEEKLELMTDTEVNYFVAQSGLPSGRRRGQL